MAGVRTALRKTTDAGLRFLIADSTCEDLQAPAGGFCMTPVSVGTIVRPALAAQATCKAMTHSERR
jgi:hypothetical protein